jgi:hypothetical protein
MERIVLSMHHLNQFSRPRLNISAEGDPGNTYHGSWWQFFQEGFHEIMFLITNLLLSCEHSLFIIRRDSESRLYIMYVKRVEIIPLFLLCM